MHPCIHASVHPCIRASVHPCIRASVHPCIRASVHPCIRASVLPCIRASVHPCIHASMHPCIHASMHRCTNAHAHAHVWTTAYYINQRAKVSLPADKRYLQIYPGVIFFRNPIRNHCIPAMAARLGPVLSLQQKHCFRIQIIIILINYR